MDLKEGQSNVKHEDWALFLKNDLKVTSKEIAAVEFHIYQQILLVRCVNQESFDRELAKLQAGVRWSKADKTVYGWSVEEALTNVRVVNLGYDVPENVVTDVLSRYGTIVSSRWGFVKELPGVRDGSLNVKIKLNKDAVLPQFISYGTSDLFGVFSDITEKVCFRCSGKGHVGIYCRRKPQAPDYTSKTWASVAAKDVPAQPACVPAIEPPVRPTVSTEPPLLTPVDSVESSGPPASGPPASGPPASGPPELSVITTTVSDQTSTSTTLSVMGTSSTIDSTLSSSSKDKDGLKRAGSDMCSDKLKKPSARVAHTPKNTK